MESDERPAIDTRFDGMPCAAVGRGIQIGHGLTDPEREEVFDVDRCRTSASTVMDSVVAPKFRIWLVSSWMSVRVRVLKPGR